MGMTDESRVEVAASAISQIHQEAKLLQASRVYSIDSIRLFSLIEELYPALFEAFRLHPDEEERASIEGWPIAFNLGLMDASRSMKEDEAIPGYYGWYKEHGPTFERILKQITSPLSEEQYVHAIYTHSKNALYALNYYLDDIFEKSKGVRKVFANIAGVCSECFGDTTYLEAYLLNQLWHVVVTGKEHDLINQIAYQHNIQHYYGGGHPALENLEMLWKGLQYEEVSLEKRLRLLYQLLGRKHHYTHVQTSFLQFVEHHNSVSEEKVDTNKMAVWFSECLTAQKKYEQEQKEKRRLDRYCQLTGKSGDE